MADKTPCNAAYKICANCCKGPPQPGLEPEQEISEGDLKLCSACRSAYFCSKECQAAAWKVHAKSCKRMKRDGFISCVVMTNPGNCKQVFLSPDNPYFDNSTLSPPMARCDIPLCLRQLVAGTNNQWCTFLMIDPISGLAPYPWSDCGEVLLCRRDRMPLTPEHIYQLGDFICNIIHRFGSPDDDSIHQTHMTRSAFLEFLQNNLPSRGTYGNALGAAW